MEKETGILGKLTSEGPACVPGFQGCCRDSGHGIRPRECPPADQLLLTALAPNPQHHPTPKDTAQGGAQRPGSQLLHLNRYSPVWLLLSLLFPLVSFPMTAFFNEPLPGNPATERLSCFLIFSFFNHPEGPLPGCTVTPPPATTPRSIVDVVLVTQSHLTLCDPVDCSPAGSSVHGILQARILEWAAIPFSRESS